MANRAYYPGTGNYRSAPRAPRREVAVDVDNTKVREAVIGLLSEAGLWPKQNVGLLPGMTPDTTVWDPYATPVQTGQSTYYQRFGSEMLLQLRQLALSRATTAGGVLLVDPMRFGFAVAGQSYDVGDAVGGMVQEVAEKVGLDATTGTDAALIKALVSILGGRG